jgi:hypothetical protein
VALLYWNGGAYSFIADSSLRCRKVAISELMGAKAFSLLEISTVRVWSAGKLPLFKEGGATLSGVWGGARHLASNSLLETGGTLHGLCFCNGKDVNETSGC